MSTTEPLDGVTPVWVARHEPALPPRRMDRPRTARVAPTSQFRAKVEAIAEAESPTADAPVAEVERHIVDCLRTEGFGRHLAPVTEDTVTRAWSDFQAMHTDPAPVGDPLAGNPTDDAHTNLLAVIRMQSEVTR